MKIVTDGVEIIIATPGRLNDLVEAGCIQIESVTYLVLDEVLKNLFFCFVCWAPPPFGGVDLAGPGSGWALTNKILLQKLTLRSHFCLLSTAQFLLNLSWNFRKGNTWNLKQQHRAEIIQLIFLLSLFSGWQDVGHGVWASDSQTSTRHSSRSSDSHDQVRNSRISELISVEMQYFSQIFLSK